MEVKNEEQEKLKENPKMFKGEMYVHLHSKSSDIVLPSIHNSLKSLYNRQHFDKQSQSALLLHAVKCLDLTTLCGDDTYSNVERLCVQAKRPINHDLLKVLGIDVERYHVAAICVYPSKIRKCSEILNDMNLKGPIAIAAVAAAFPSGQFPLETRLQEIRLCVHDGATEIDIVIERQLVLTKRWFDIYRHVCEMKAVCGGAKLKVIISAGELGSLDNVYKTSFVCMAAGADFIKTSTGKESVNATLPIGLVIMKAIKRYYRCTRFKVGFKVAGGIRTAQDVLAWQQLVLHELGRSWLVPDLFRIGASSVLGNIEENILHFVTGKTNAKHLLPY